MTTANPAADAASAAADAVQKVASPVAFIAIVGAACLGAAMLIRRLGASLPLPGYLADLVGGDDEEDQGADDEGADEEDDE